jgi:hypothetical protein
MDPNAEFFYSVLRTRAESLRVSCLEGFNIAHAVGNWKDPSHLHLTEKEQSELTVPHLWMDGMENPTKTKPEEELCASQFSSLNIRNPRCGESTLSLA